MGFSLLKIVSLCVFFPSPSSWARHFHFDFKQAVGASVGYHVRFESAFSAETRLVFATHCTPESSHLSSVCDGSLESQIAALAQQDSSLHVQKEEEKRLETRASLGPLLYTTWELVIKWHVLESQARRAAA